MKVGIIIKAPLLMALSATNKRDKRRSKTWKKTSLLITIKKFKLKSMSLRRRLLKKQNPTTTPLTGLARQVNPLKRGLWALAEKRASILLLRAELLLYKLLQITKFFRLLINNALIFKISYLQLTKLILNMLLSPRSSLLFNFIIYTSTLTQSS